MTNEELYSLIEKYIKGDQYSFTLLFNNTKNKVFANIYSFVKDETIADDILIDTYVNFISNIKKIKKNQSILGYLYVISKNLSLNYLTRNKKNDSLDDYPHLTINQHNAQNQLDYEDIIIIMKKVLSDDMFKVVIMRLIDEMEYSEIAKLLKKKEATIRWLYSQALKLVKEELNARQY